MFSRNLDSCAACFAFLLALTSVAQNPVLVASPATPIERQYLTFLKRETARRTNSNWQITPHLAQSSPARTAVLGTIVLGTVAEMEELLPRPLFCNGKRGTLRSRQTPKATPSHRWANTLSSLRETRRARSSSLLAGFCGTRASRKAP